MSEHTSTDGASQSAVNYCPVCWQAYQGYHSCPEGPDRVVYDCIDCGDHVDRETHDLDLKGIVPKRCTECTFDRMAQRGNP